MDHVPLPFGISSSATENTDTLHLLVPADKGDHQLCRLMLATSILGYPTPHLVNWGLKFQEQEGGAFQMAAGTHLAKITGVIKWLWALERHQMKDLVAVVDAYDLTFQLPPEILIKQYHRVNQEWNAHMSEQPGMKQVMKKHGFYQSVVFSADKRCSPQMEWEPWCYLQPVSPLPADLYGNRTDTNIGWDLDKLQAVRARWVNSGLVMGPADDMLALFTRAYQQMAQQRLGSDQSLFNFVFAEQEFKREYQRQEYLNSVGNEEAYLSKLSAQHGQIGAEFDALSPEQKIIDAINPSSKDYKLLAPALEREHSEFHMGLDYSFRLSKPTVSALHEVRQLTFNTTPPTGNMTRDIRDCQTPDPVLLEHLGQIRAPFPANFTAPGHPVHPETWADCPLFTDMCSGEIPVSIHHNGHKMNREYQWPEMWYHRYAKDYLLARQEEAELAERDAIELGVPAPDINDGRAWAGERKIAMDDVCPGALNMVFHGCMWGHGWECAPGEVPVSP